MPGRQHRGFAFSVEACAQGALSFGTANDILKRSESVFSGHDALEIDLSGIDKADSACRNPRYFKNRFQGFPKEILQWNGRSDGL